jgi:streptomycin 6-kinase
VHAIRLDPTADLPLRVRPISGDDHAMERRWANLYRACEAAERPAVVQALSELTGWPPEHAQRMLEATGPASSAALLQLADDRVRAMDRPAVATVFVHGDVHHGNILWDGDACLALIDWKDAGAGDPGVDLGELRKQVAIQYGPGAPEHVLEGWQAQTGRQATNVAYWDAVAALNTSAVVEGPRTPAERAAATQRRDEFLRTALDRLEPSDRIPRASRYA